MAWGAAGALRAGGLRQLTHRDVRVLVVNAGSSSVKLSLVGERDHTLAQRELQAPRAEVDVPQLKDALSGELGHADAVGHRIVHGGEEFVEGILLDADVEDRLRALSDLAPLHQPKSLAALDAVSALLPDTLAVACFDTAFHHSLPEAAATYALPAAWRRGWGVRKYGFHGLSHAWVARRIPELLGEDWSHRQRIVSAHLGAGASLCAIDRGRSVDTTMGFTPLDGLVMATRSGSVDPGLLLWLLEQEAMTEGQLAEGLEHESGLLGLAGSADMREILDRAGAGEPAAELALAVYLHRLRAGIAAMAAALGGVDALVFTGGVGGRSPAVRSGAGERLGFLGVALDESRNRHASGDAEIGTPGHVRTFVLSAREDLEIARQVRAVLA